MEKSHMEQQCPICGGDVATTDKVREVRIGQRSVNIRQTAPECAECGEVFYTPDAADALQMRAASAIREQEGLLAPSAIRRIREKLALSQAEFERLLGVGPKTVVRWERGTVFQNSATDTLLRVLAAVPQAVAYLSQMKGVAGGASRPRAAVATGPAGASVRYNYTETDASVIPIGSYLPSSPTNVTDAVPDPGSDLISEGIA